MEYKAIAFLLLPVKLPNFLLVDLALYQDPFDCELDYPIHRQSDRPKTNIKNIPCIEYNEIMKWNIIFDPDFKIWFYQQEQGLQDETFAVLSVLGEFGSKLGRPRVDTLEGSTFPNMKELRIQYQGEPWRILFAFDSKRKAVLLIGGNKTGNKRWYKENIAIADKRSKKYLEILKEENK